MKCKKCSCEDAENYYKNSFDEVICEDCLLELDGVESHEITQYFIEGEFIGDDLEDIQEVIDKICFSFNLERVE